MKLRNQEILYINALNSLTGARVRGCWYDEGGITYLLEQNQMRLAIGKNGSSIRNLRARLGKNVELMEYSEKPEVFVRRALAKVRISGAKVVEKDGKKTIRLTLDPENRRKLMQSTNRLRRVRETVKRAYGIGEIKIDSGGAEYGKW